MQLPICVISLARVTEWRASIVDRLNKAGVKYEIVDAVDGCTLDMSTVMHRIKNPNILKNVTACFLSHYNLWARIVDERIPHAIILEDDAAWDHDFFTLANELPQIKWQWDVINLCYKTRIRIDTVLCKIGARNLVRNVRPTNYAIGYAVSYEGAQKMVKHCYKIRCGVDLQRRQYWRYGLAFYSIDPPAGFHSGAPSTMEYDTAPSGYASVYDFVRWKLAKLQHKIGCFVYNLMKKPKCK